MGVVRLSNDLWQGVIGLSSCVIARSLRNIRTYSGAVAPFSGRAPKRVGGLHLPLTRMELRIEECVIGGSPSGPSDGPSQCSGAKVQARKGNSPESRVTPLKTSSVLVRKSHRKDRWQVGLEAAILS